MKFLVLMAEPDHFERWEKGDDAYQQRAFDDMNAFAKAVRERGTLVFGDALERPENARSVQPGDERTVTEGPYAETVELVGGFYVIELDDHQTAVELAKLLPRDYTIEVRPLLGVTV